MEQYYAWEYLPINATRSYTRERAIRESKEPVLSHGPLFPGIANHATITTEPLPLVTVAALTSHIWAIHVYGRISYVDIFGRRHWTDYCFHSHADTAEWHTCATGNGTDDGDQGKANPPAAAPR
jgi:hypothetical protein